VPGIPYIPLFPISLTGERDQDGQTEENGRRLVKFGKVVDHVTLYERSKIYRSKFMINV